jgi:hypothetical protein
MIVARGHRRRGRSGVGAAAVLVTYPVQGRVCDGVRGEVCARAR